MLNINKLNKLLEMKNKLIQCIILFSLVLYIKISAQDYHVRIGTIGNSITHGVMLTNPEQDAYPVHLGTMLEDIYGDTCIVKNFGLTTTTMLKNGDVSYWDTEHLKNYLAWAPEICLILLGTNDTKPQNWDLYADEFIGDYLAMIDTIKQRNPYTKFLLGYPPPAFAVMWGIRDSVVINGVIPAIDSIVKLVDAEIIDFYHPMLDSSHLFPDAIHPDVAGNTFMAEILLNKIIETDIIHKADTGLTFITGFGSETAALIKDESTTLNWTTINADSVFLDGQPVVVNGSITVSPTETTVFTLVAMGKKSIDTVTYNQIVYIPELSRVQISPSKTTRDQGDTVLFEITYYDQYNKKITNTTFPVEWEVIEGGGVLFGETNTSVYFIAQTADTNYLQVSYGDVSTTARIVVKPSATDIKNQNIRYKFQVFPNPCTEILNVKLDNITGNYNIQIYDLKGSMHYCKIYNNKEYIIINTDNLKEGNYILKIEYLGNMYSKKFQKIIK